jgi:hypothetical protein
VTVVVATGSRQIRTLGVSAEVFRL